MRPGVRYCRRSASTSSRDGPVYGAGRCSDSGSDTRRRLAADAPRLLETGPVDGADEVLVGHRVRRLLQLPQVLRQARDGGRRVEDDLGPGQAEAAGALGEVAVVADVDADLADARVEDRVAE